MSKDFVAINISNNDMSYPPSAKLFCNLCSRNLVYQIHKKRNGDVTDAILLTISPKGRK